MPAREGNGQKPFSLVGIGASAGGLQVLETFFDQVPEASEVAFVVVTHLSAERESHLHELLQQHTKMPVRSVEERVQIQPGHVYVLRAGRDLEVDGRHLTLRKRPKDQPVRTTIDRFFYSLADAWGAQAVGIVLSGSGSDGSRGLAAVKAAGGLTMAQTPEDAQYGSMPQYAIDTGHVDVVDSADELARKLREMHANGDQMRSIPREEALESSGKILQKIFLRLRAETGHDFTGYKRSTILRRLRRRMQLYQIESLERYLEMLREQPEETERLYQDLLIPVTRFFRDPGVYEALSDRIIPELFDDKGPDDEVRIWVPGCATGEEAYSLVILVEEARRIQRSNAKLQIFATDVDRKAIEKGRRGQYPAAIAGDVSVEHLEEFFTEQRHGYRVVKSLRESVLFAVHNVLKDPPFSDVDLISCRNLLIYLEKDLQQHVFERFHFALRPEGHLVLGSSESVGAAEELFKMVDQSNRIYRRRPGATRPLRFSTSEYKSLELPTTDALDTRSEKTDFSDRHQRLIAEQYGPTSILIDEDYHILDLTRGENPFLKYPEKKPPHSVEDIVVEALRPEVRSGLFRLFQKDTPTARKPVRLERLGEKREVLLTIRSVDFGENLAQVVLEGSEDPSEEAEIPTDQEEITAAASATIRELDEELQQTKEHLRATIEGYETRTEELRSSNEELLAMNEELESTTEELETREEELQAMNEELAAVNSELKRKVQELEEAYSDLKNFIAATHVGAVFLDEELRVRRFTPEITEVLELADDRLGTPLNDIPHRLRYDRLVEDVGQVLEARSTIEREVGADEDRWYVVQIRPYRTVQEEIGGVALSFFDITRRKHVEQELHEMNEELEERVAERTRQLEAANEKLKEQMTERERLEQEVLEVSEEERWRIGESLHEDAGQTLTGVMLLLDSHLRDLKEEEYGDVEEVKQIRDLIEEVDDRLLDLARGIIPLPLGESTTLSHALGHLAEEMEGRYGIRCRARISDDLLVESDEHATHLYRIVQEAIQNAVLHGEASEIVITFDIDEDGRQVLTITDDGSGPEVDISEMGKKGMGLRLMQYRCRCLNGDFSLEEPDAGGMQVVCRFPPRNLGPAAY